MSIENKIDQVENVENKDSKYEKWFEDFLSKSWKEINDKFTNEKDISFFDKVKQKYNTIIHSEDFKKSKETTEKALEAFGEGEYLKWLIEESDKIALENNDLELNSTFIKSAANISSLILDFLEDSNKWDKKVELSKEDNNSNLEKTTGTRRERERITYI